MNKTTWMLPIARMLMMAVLGCGLCVQSYGQNSSLLHAAPVASRMPAFNGPGLRTAVSQLPAPQGTNTQGTTNQGSGTRGSGTRGLGTRGSAGATPTNADQTQSSANNGAVSQATYNDRPNIMLDGASWTYQSAPPMRTFRLNDVVTIRVDEITRVMAEGSAEARKRTLSEAILTDWIRIQDFRLRPDPQANGDPAVAAESNSNYRAESTVESRESMTFNIAATVVDIRPNGNLLLEAKKSIRVNDNLWETSLSGLCRAQDIGPDNVVLSKDVIDLEIQKADRGHLRDGYKRGWFQRWLDRFQPF